jgi:hypothetical protein
MTLGTQALQLAEEAKLPEPDADRDSPCWSSCRQGAQKEVVLCLR